MKIVAQDFINSGVITEEATKREVRHNRRKVRVCDLAYVMQVDAKELAREIFVAGNRPSEALKNIKARAKRG